VVDERGDERLGLLGRDDAVLHDERGRISVAIRVAGDLMWDGSESIPGPMSSVNDWSYFKPFQIDGRGPLLVIIFHR
ncbi:hypothetical protein BRD08_04690, partial [Halobacteriales archaeon SW_10_66_29]